MTGQNTDLACALRALGEHGDRLTVFALAPEQLDEILRELDTARRLLLAVRAAQGPTGCARHPHAPADPTSGGACLLCTTNRRTGQAAQPTEVAPVADICRAVRTEGRDAAIARFGGRAVARAVNACRNDPAFLEESA